MIKIIFDFDNTMGVEGCDVDDGLALLYLLGRSDVKILGITTTYGNSTIDTVHNNTIEMFKDLNISHIPLYKGSACKSNRKSEAAEFLAKAAAEHKNEITLLATGSLTNLYGAYEIDNNFFKNLKQIVLMGGITKPLIINGKNLDELNFSCDPKASLKVLSSGIKVTTLDAHICLQAFFGEKEYERLTNSNIPIYKYINDKTKYWFNHVMKEFEIKGFYNWDIVSAVYITNPELFEDNFVSIVSTEDDLSRGYLKISSSPCGYTVNIPSKIKDIDLFNEIIFKAWANVNITKKV
ncbi:Inosine-uridine nucleoside N-ribohydrolase [Alkalithermobacter thermoalcaliphilus JW-YL-7 = DSM 7308]|uniref:Inosine-uridine nucleoside N-ribohydrolase n=1 Tax=Alkalithermobacter thermoalcaliphilus JW-YL-7 = DSM 7308 TaxID=1121328 RepID=A0A150FQT5_CLOPD|nr:Inosine/uridine-preferring nucleoside hydrolase [[Clostridium] paradoxum JW-YL-7 = DSM 7308]SHK76547.1 Inosine-uridine nucleoside N-ribohydrolase [[Clostridium] paradoxum JW-YL-7 = DSM 7308]